MSVMNIVGGNEFNISMNVLVVAVEEYVICMCKTAITTSNFYY